MMSTRRRCFAWSCALLLLCTLASGCVSRQVASVTYYRLLSMAQLGTPVTPQAASGLRIGIGPITIPDALQRAQLVTRDARHVYRFSEGHRWAGGVEKDIAYVLADNLGALLGTEQIAFFPWNYQFVPTHRVIIDIVQFDGELAGDAVLSARWAIAGADSKVTLTQRKSVLQRPVTVSSYAGLVAEESRLLGELSQEIAAEIRKLAAQE